MDINTAALNAKPANKVMDAVTLGLYSVGIGAGAVVGLMGVLLLA